jgi:cytochrome c oxidase subunit 6b
MRLRSDVFVNQWYRRLLPVCSRKSQLPFEAWLGSMHVPLPASSFDSPTFNRIPYRSEYQPVQSTTNNNTSQTKPTPPRNTANMSDDEERVTMPFKFVTAGFDARFPNQNQTKHCWQNYVDYHKCINAKGEDFKPCRQVCAYLSHYRTATPRLANAQSERSTATLSNTHHTVPPRLPLPLPFGLGHPLGRPEGKRHFPRQAGRLDCDMRVVRARRKEGRCERERFGSRDTESEGFVYTSRK